MQAIKRLIGLVCCGLMLRVVVQYGGAEAVIFAFIFLVARSTWTYKRWIDLYAIRCMKSVLLI